MDKIDFVLLWVDGSDPEWQKEKNKYYNGEQNQNNACIYRDWDTLRYWFRAVEKYAPWVNRIHFVTCGHLPDWLDVENPKLHVVKHSDFIPADCLPTFSANSIELNINKIEGLEEKFVYFNDDTFIADYVSESDFFRNGLPCDSAVMSLTIPSVANEIFTYILVNDLLHTNLKHSKKSVYKHLTKWINPRYGLKACLKNIYYLPIKKYSGFENLHLPNSYLKSVWDEVWIADEEILRQTISRRFRTKEDVNQYIFKYWQLVTGRFSPRSRKIGRMFTIGDDDSLIEKNLLGRQYKLVCVNDNPNEIDFEAEKEKLICWFEKLLPEKSSFEKE